MDKSKMVFSWAEYPSATHCDKAGFCFYLQDESGVWMLLDTNGFEPTRSISLYNGQISPSDLFKRPEGE